MSVLVLGSLNIDLVVRTPRFPLAGETLTGRSFFQAYGGKGANQAVAAARIGAETKMFGRVGDDFFGEGLRQQLEAAGIDSNGVSVAAGEASGIALITIADNAQNQIIIVQGANGLVGANEISNLRAALAGAKVLLLQLEIPLETVYQAAKIAAESGLTVVLDPAPVPVEKLPDRLYEYVSILTPNETEAASLVGFPLTDEMAIKEAGRVLHRRGSKVVIIKLGSRGIFWTDGKVEEFRPTFPVQVIDTVGAGDAFNGALATALVEGQTLPKALNWGLAGGALAVTRPGAQSAMPYREEVAKLLLQTHF